MCIDRCIKDVAYSLAHFVEVGLSCEGYQLTDSNEVHASLIKNLEPLVKERLNLPKDQNINQVLSKIFDVEKAKKELIAEGGDYQKRVKTLNSIKIKATRRFNRICAYYYCEKEIILKNLSTIIKSIIATLKDKRYKPFSRSLADIIEWAKLEEEGHEFFDFDDLFERYYQKEINNKESNNESKEVSSEETNENEKLNEEKSNVIKEFEFQIFDLRVKSFSTRQHKFCGHGNRFDEVLYFKNLKEFVRNVFLCELYNENTVLKNFCEEIYPWRELTEIVKPSFCDSYDYLTDIDFRIKINKEWYKETLIIKKKLTSNFNKLYKTFYKDRWLILENLDKIFDPIINDYKKEGTFQLKENHSEINEKDQENEINENESNNESKEVSSEEINNNNDKDQENGKNENEDNNTKKDPWFFIIRNAKVEVGV